MSITGVYEMVVMVISLCLYRAKHGALNCLEKLVNHDGIDLDIKNTVEGDTPLHKAVVYDEDPEIALALVELLLEAEADPR